MKKKIIFLTFVSLTLASCSRDNGAIDNPTNPTNPTNPSNPTITEKVYAFKYIDNGINSIVEINANNGSEISTLTSLGSLYLKNPKYFPATDEIIGEVTENNIKKFFKFKISNSAVTKTQYNGYDDFVIANNKIFAFKYDGVNNSIVELNPTNGTEISTLKNVGTAYLKNFTFSTSTGNIFCENSNPKSLYVINITNGSSQNFPYFGYDDMTIANNGKLYAYKYIDNSNTSLVEINPGNGAEIQTIKNLGTKYLSNIQYLNSTNEIIGETRLNAVKSYFKTKTDGTSTETNYFGYEEIMVK